MRYVGLDVHVRQSTFCVLDGKGQKLLTRTVRGPVSKVVEALGEVKQPFAKRAIHDSHPPLLFVSRFLQPHLGIAQDGRMGLIDQFLHLHMSQL